MFMKARVRGSGISTNLLTLFLLYHMCHKLALFALVEIALVNDWLSDAHGFDFEIWNQWLNWILVATNVVAIGKYTRNIGVDLDLSIASVMLVLVPGFGADAHFAKDWLFIGVTFRQSQVARRAVWAIFAYVLGITSIATLFLPTLYFLLGDKYRAQPALAENFIYSHWPIVGAQPALGARSSAFRARPGRSAQRKSQETLVDLMIRQTTPWHTDLIFTSELPQGILELLFCISFTGKPVALFAMSVSAAKFCFIRALVSSVPAFVEALGSCKYLVIYAKTHGITITHLMRLLFGGVESDWQHATQEIRDWQQHSQDIPKLREALTGIWGIPNGSWNHAALRENWSHDDLSHALREDQSQDALGELGVLAKLSLSRESRFLRSLVDGSLVSGNLISKTLRRFPHQYEALWNAQLHAVPSDNGSAYASTYDSYVAPSDIVMSPPFSRQGKSQYLELCRTAESVSSVLRRWCFEMDDGTAA